MSPTADAPVGPPLVRPEVLAADLAIRAGSRRVLVALDHDGTLSPIVDRPELAALEPGARSALAALAEVAEVVVVSGRGLDDLTDRLGDLGVTLVGEHGLRLRAPDGDVDQLVPGPDAAVLAALRTRLAALLDEPGTATGWIVEDKGVGLAVHHRLVAAEHLEPTLGDVRAALEEAAARGGALQTGKAVLELRAEGADKGAALRHLAARRPDVFVVMVGDDVTDEPALAAAEGLGGVGVLVADAPRPSDATVRVEDPAAVVALLTALAGTLSPG